MTRLAQLHGGPYDGEVGETVSPLPDPLLLGDNGGFVYRLQGVKDGQVRYRYSPSETRRRLLDLGVHPSLAAQAGERDTGRALAVGASLTPDQGSAFTAEVQRFPDRWELKVNDTLVERLPRAAFGDDDTAGLAQWAEAAVHALAQEATR